MVVLVLGNGFDLAHDLQTSYPEFLEFVKMYSNDVDDVHKQKQFHEFVNQIRSGEDEIAKEAKELLAKENRWLDYFLDVYEKRIKEGKDRWVDFETEISDVIQAFGNAREFNSAAIARGETKPALPKSILDKISSFLFAGEHKQLAGYYSYTPEFLERFPESMLGELNDLIRLFEIYLIEFVEKMDVNIRIPEIYKLGSKIDKVISFNYTDTYRRLYRKKEAVACCFIHGKASKEKTCNLVLGIDEFQKDSSRDDNNVFIWFKKFYQRIYKETSSEYIDWLEDDIEEKESEKEKLPSYIYFYGHSLAETDKDVLNKLIMHENAIIRIFYHSKDAMAKQISNLVKIIGEEKLIHMTRGRNRKIEFWPASKAIDEASIL